MNARFSRTAAALSLAAAMSMAATPALARDHNWGGGNWGGGWGHRHHDRVDAGDVIAGVLILGGIAAIASAASNSNKAKRARQRDDDYQYPDQSYPRQENPQRGSSSDYGNDTRPDYNDSRGESRWDPNGETSGQSRGLDRAVDRCAGEIERGDRRIDVIEEVARQSDGWRVTGRITGGDSFECSVDRDGRVSNSKLDGRAI
jgi:hypothetical protein